MTPNQVLNPLLHRKLHEQESFCEVVVKYQKGHVVHTSIKFDLKEKELNDLITK